MTDDILREWTEFYNSKVSGDRGRKLTEGYVKYVESFQKSGLPPIFEFSHLSDLVGVDFDILAKMANRPQDFYRSFTIPKRSGGIRKIDTPRPILLHIQRWILDEILSKSTVSEQAHGFIEGRSIVTNSRAHLGCRELLKMDIKDFFPSVSISTVNHIFSNMGYPPSLCKSLSRLVTLGYSLPQGAPTSPALSNIACLDLDSSLNSLALEHGLTYTRYADDLSFSGGSIPSNMTSLVETVVSKAGLLINSKKTIFSPAGHRKIITGISISSGELKLPRPYIRKLRQKIHLLLRHGTLHLNNDPSPRDPLILDRVLGMVSFWLAVSPECESAKKANSDLRKFIDDFATS
jgi:RNA-directed DNA polymerase